ncbi:MAG: selenocysteine-specific translation elongation factor [Dehalococcoidia bacterium]|nr:selenocysteine-specific translation elongation factor [Dehalococcoidia bacterium]
MHVIGTAGHVDHGKSTLVKALTGTDPDRLAEEKQRGLTIDLGFAWLTLPNGIEVSIVDVPGHEKFIRNMLAGVGAIDLGLLVVAANESIMPQTREHISILEVLGIQNIIVVISKSDLVDQELSDLVKEEIDELLRETHFNKAAIVMVSAITGEGIQKLIESIERLLTNVDPTEILTRPRLSVDRSFTISGFGTVVTGTLIGGSVSVGQEIEIIPSGTKSRIRGIQSHKQKLQTARPGRRVALNLSGISHDSVSRGYMLAEPGWLSASKAVNGKLKVLGYHRWSIKHNSRVMFYCGAAETTASVRLLGSEVVDPGEEALVQLRLDNPIPIVAGDHFVIRNSETTLGGGIVLETNAKRHKRYDHKVIKKLTAIYDQNNEQIVLDIIEANGPMGIDAISKIIGIEIEELTFILGLLADKESILVLGNAQTGSNQLIFSSNKWSEIKNNILTTLSIHHETYPLAHGINRESLRSHLALETVILNQILDRLSKENQIENVLDSICLYGWKVTLSEAEESLISRYLEELKEAPYSPAPTTQLESGLLQILIEKGLVVKLRDAVIFDAGIYESMVGKIINSANMNGHITVGQVRDMFDTSRKYAIAILEHLDQRKLTRRVDEWRVLI